MSQHHGFSRRTALKLGAAATALPLVHIRTAGAAGKVSIGFWDHWVPGGNDVMQKQVDAWAEKNKVEAHADFITSTGNKLQITGAAEAQAKTGHDALAFFNWDVFNIADSLEPIDDVVQRLVAKNGAVDATCEYLAKAKGHWVAVPSSSGTQTKPPCARIGWFKQHGLDIQAMYPAKEEHNAQQDAWTWDAFAKYAEAASKDGMTFALGMGGGGNTDATDTHGALFKAFGATLIDADGKSQLKSDAIRQVLEYAQRLVKSYPADAVSFDDASNNRALISGKSALIFNPPSAWAVAKRDAPAVAADCWTFPAPSGPKGRFVPTLSYFWGVFKFSQNKPAAKDLIEYPDAAGAGGGAQHRHVRLRHPALCRAAELQRLAGGGAAEGHRLQLSDPSLAQPEAEPGGGRGSAGHRGADLQPRDPQPDDGTHQGWSDDPAGDRLGAG